MRQKKDLTRLGSMFGAMQFCYAEKPGGVEPGFRAIDLNELFFQELNKILADENLSFEKQLSTQESLKFAKLRENLKTDSLSRKQKIFSMYINSHVKGPHEKGTFDPSIKWLCNEIKEAVAKNDQLSAWMYKLDYAEGQKNRIKANKEAIREFIGTCLAGIFSKQNQKQGIAWISNGKNEMHALLVCGWKNGLQELTQFLHAGSEPDYNGVLVEDKNAPIKRSKYIPGLGKNLIFGIAIGDRDGIGKEAQNKGLADGAFYGFDYGKPYDGPGICSSLSDDFSFEDSYAKAPSIFRGSSPIGLARHFMYRNYSIFYDTSLSERMEGFHLLRKMITGENPNEEVIKSYPGLRKELYRIQENTPSTPELLNKLGEIRLNCHGESQLEVLVDTHIMQIFMEKLSTFDLYFVKIKIGLIDMAIKNDMAYEELEEYIKFIDEMKLTAHKSNQYILAAFKKRMLLTKQEIDLIDKLEMYFSPTSVISHDGTVFLNRLRFDPKSGRIPFQLKREENGTYTLSTTNTTIAKQLKNDFSLDFIQEGEGLKCNISHMDLKKIMKKTDMKYTEKREYSLIKPTYRLITFPRLDFYLNSSNDSETLRTQIVFLWHKDHSLSLKLIAKTDEQADKIARLFAIPPALNEEKIIEISPTQHDKFHNLVAMFYEEEQNLLQRKMDVSVESRKSLSSISIHSSINLNQQPF